MVEEVGVQDSWAGFGRKGNSSCPKKTSLRCSRGMARRQKGSEALAGGTLQEPAWAENLASVGKTESRQGERERDVFVGCSSSYLIAVLLLAPL